jgi:serine O-acetyltransferase
MYLNAMDFYRVGRWFKQRKIPLVPLFVDLAIFLVFNSKVPLECEIGEGTYCGHRGIAIVIHPEAVIGKRCELGSCVTIGGGGKGKPGAPVIGDDVMISTGAKVLGGVRIGNGVTIGANAVVITDIPDGATAVGVPARIISRA